MSESLPDVDKHCLYVGVASANEDEQPACDDEQDVCILRKGIFSTLTPDPRLLESSKRHTSIERIDAIYLFMTTHQLTEGIASVSTVRTQTVPACTLFATRIARLRSLVKMAAARPYMVSFACLITSIDTPSRLITTGS
jgi:hypothetical protein